MNEEPQFCVIPDEALSELIHNFIQFCSAAGQAGCIRSIAIVAHTEPDVNDKTVFEWNYTPDTSLNEELN